jgi:transcriptional regulator with XRE-family HTH domain
MSEFQQIPEWTLADRLRKARESAGLSQQEMADHLGLSRVTVGTYENGATPKLAVLRVWAMRTGVPLDWLRAVGTMFGVMIATPLYVTYSSGVEEIPAIGPPRVEPEAFRLAS